MSIVRRIKDRLGGSNRGDGNISRGGSMSEVVIEVFNTELS